MSAAASRGALKASIEQHLDLLTVWEATFVSDLAQSSPRQFSAKQRAILADIAIKVRSAGHQA